MLARVFMKQRRGRHLIKQLTKDDSVNFSKTFKVPNISRVFFGFFLLFLHGMAIFL